ncbi:DUF4232 domain-containing protein [Streptomyces niveiscabiei]|uniref:DUF4232 domain-containing protein n=1 Tax=Streptomyces niveiscabiei TaxID=164115 RepID=A0ABW9I750_9ACTN
MNMHRSTLLALAATALTLSLTACQSGEGAKSSAATPEATVASAPVAAASTAEKSTGTTGTSGTSAGSAKSTGSQGSATANGSAGTGSSAGTKATTPTCTAADVRITAALQDGPPYTHIVLTAKNTGRHSCRLAGFPRIQFLESHKQDVPAVAKSKPAAPVVLAAGAPAYALVKLSDGGVDEDNEPVSAFQVMLEGDSTVIAVTAPGKEGIAVDPAKALTGYWTYELRNGADDF